MLAGSPASKSGAVTGGSIVVGATNDAFSIAGTFNGTVLAATAVTVANATYSTAGSYQTALQNGLDAALTANGIAAGSVKASVTDVGGGVWKVELASSATAAGAGFTISATEAGFGGVVNGASSNNGSFSASFQVGANNGESLSINFSGVSSTSLSTSGISLVTGAAAAITTLDSAIGTVSTTRATLGAYQNRFEHTINNLNRRGGEPVRVREPDPRHGHGGRDALLHPLADPQPGRHRDVGPGQLRAAGDSSAAPQLGNDPYGPGRERSHRAPVGPVRVPD